MPDTPKLALTYPPPTGVAPDVPFYLQELAQDVEREIADAPLGILEFTAGTLNIPNGAYASVTGGTIVTNVGCTMTTSSIQVPKTGAYLVTAGVSFSPNATGVRYGAIDVGGTVVRIGGIGAFASGQATPTVSAILKLTAGNVVSLKAFQSSGGLLSLAGGPLTHLALSFLRRG